MRLKDANILKLVPAFMRSDAAVQGLANGVNPLIREPGAKVKQLRVWDQIDELDDQRLDELAWELDIDWYSSALPIERKRELVRISDMIHSRRGTKWAVEQLITAYIAPGFIIEWFEDEYINPKPFHYSVYTSHHNVTDAMLQEFFTVAKIAKSVRSRIDMVYFADTYGATVSAGKNVEIFTFQPKKCGTIPRQSTIGAIRTTPAAVAGRGIEADSFELLQSGEEKAGRLPTLSVIGAIREPAEIEAASAATASGFGIIKCGTAKCG